VCSIAHLDRWMSAEGLQLGELSGSVLEHYLAGRRAAGYVVYPSVKALRPLLDYLTPLDVLPVAEEVWVGPVTSYWPATAIIC
jgi:integrase/recombinase XerD